MNILFLTLGKINVDENSLYSDLVNELSNQGNNVYVLIPIERRNKLKNVDEFKNNVTIYKAHTLNITKSNIIEKGLATLLIKWQFIKKIKKDMSKISFDIVLYTTPPVTLSKVIRFIKKRDKSFTYLILKDIFPQNAVDLNLIKKNSLIHRYFKNKENELFKVSDVVGCTSIGNIAYIKENNYPVKNHSLDLFPNSIKPRPIFSSEDHRIMLRKQLNIPSDAVIFIYGGNIGLPQGFSFIKQVLKSNQRIESLYYIICGSGTKFNVIKEYVDAENIKNVLLMEAVSSNKYWEIVQACDVGLIFLDKRFSVPNTPARLTYYMEASLPILAATDKSTDIKDILNKSNSGYWCESGDLEEFQRITIDLIKDRSNRENLGRNGRNYLEKNLRIEDNCKLIIKRYKEWRKYNVQK